MFLLYVLVYFYDKNRHNFLSYLGNIAELSLTLTQMLQCSPIYDKAKKHIKHALSILAMSHDLCWLSQDPCIGPHTYSCL